MSNQTNISMKHKNKHRCIKILNQDINKHNQRANVPNENSGTLNVQSRYGYPLIDSSNAMFASSQVQVWPSKTILSGVAILWTPYFGSCIFHSMVNSIFIWKMILLIRKNDSKSLPIFVLFFKKDKQNKKENPKYDSSFWKR